MTWLDDLFDPTKQPIDMTRSWTCATCKRTWSPLMGARRLPTGEYECAECAIEAAKAARAIAEGTP